MNRYYLYILSSRHHRFLNIGVTGDLVSGINRHRSKVSRQLKKKRVLQKLVYIESIDNLEDAIDREISLKRASRRELDRLVESVNPGWDSISLSQLIESGFDSNRLHQA